MWSFDRQCKRRTSHTRLTANCDQDYQSPQQIPNPRFQRRTFIKQVKYCAWIFALPACEEEQGERREGSTIAGVLMRESGENCHNAAYSSTKISPVGGRPETKTKNFTNRKLFGKPTMNTAARHPIASTAKR
ncbi:MAG: hypothetical protein IPJ05_01265 [Nitrosomonas sp.]|nr:hypothetical protein [Nitrosomonas sp.]